jgi:hypothetical protein
VASSIEDAQLPVCGLEMFQVLSSFWGFVALCGSLTFKGKLRLRVFDKRVLRRLFGDKRDKVIEGWRKLHNEELHNLYTSANIRTVK